MPAHPTMWMRRSGLSRSSWPAHMGLYLLTLWAALTVNFLLPRALPGDPITAMQDPTSDIYVADDTARARLAAYYGLDRPLGEQYLGYLKGIATGDLGWSIQQNVPVTNLIRTHLPWTLLLVIPSLLLATLITVIAGAESAWVRGSRSDRTMLAIFTVFRTIPVFFLGIVALVLFSVRLGWFPVAGATTPFREWSSPWLAVLDVLHHWALPAILMTIELIGGRYLLMRNSMVTVLGEDYMLVARAKGLPEQAVKYRHGMRNAVLPVMTAFSAQLGFAVAGAIFIETLFAYPGMGRLMFTAVSVRDYPVLEGTFLVVTVSVLTINLLTDLAYRRLDPRVGQP